MRRALVPTLLIRATTAAAQQRAPAIESIRKDEMKADLVFLASDSLRGRLTDTPENRIAAEWIAARFERLGLKPARDDGSYYQEFTLMTAAPGEGSQLSVDGASDGAAPATGQDFFPLRFSAGTSASGEVVFAGFGITSQERGYQAGWELATAAGRPSLGS